MNKEQQLKQKEIETYEEEERRRRECEKEKQKEEKKEKIKLESKIIAKEKETSTYTEKVKIPIVKLDKPETEIKEIEVDSEISEIAKEEVKTTIPIIELEKSNIELKQIELDSTLPKIAPQEREMKIPIIRVGRPRKVVSIITTFDERWPQIKATKTILRVPIYRISKPVIREIISSFDNNIDTQILQSLVTKREEKVEVIEKVQTIERETLAMAGEPSGGKEYLEEEIPDIVNFIFGVPNSKILSKGPKIILYKELEKDHTIISFETICARIYREREGGEPEFKPFEKIDNFNKKEIEKWINAGGKLIDVDLDKAVGFEDLPSAKQKIKDWCTRKKLGETLRRTTLGRLGFLIFKISDKDLYDSCEREIEKLIEEYRNLKIIYVKPKPLGLDVKRELASLCWGNLNPEDPEMKGVVFLDDIFNIFKKRFEDELKKVIREPYITITKRHRGSNESDEHYQIKVFVVKYIADVLGLRGDRDVSKMKALIHTETDEEVGKITPDISVDRSAPKFGNEVFEIETLFGEGEYALKKIDETIEKYEKMATSPKRVNIVLENLTFLMHLKEIWKKKKIHKNLQKDLKRNFELEFWTLDIQNNKLLPLEDVIKRIKRIENLYMPDAL